MAAISLALAYLAAPLAGMAQEARRIPRIGLLGPSPTDPLVEAFKQGLHELGYVDGHNIRIEYRDVAADLVRLKVDVIVAASQRAVAARQATATIPIVMPIITDPVRLGLVASLARPGGNATGLATQNDELPGKWLELARDTIPSLTRVTVLFHPTYDGGVQLKAAEGDLPVQQPTKFELVMNRRAAKAIGLTIPPAVLLRADRILE
jgi:putative ABC transport system substrate-binding protein